MFVGKQKNMPTKDVHHKHDSIFKIGMQRLEIAESAIKSYLPAEIVDQIKLNTLELCSGSFLDKNALASYTDILYSVNFIDDSKGYLYFLWEHQSTYDKHIALRLLKYSCSIMHYSHQPGK